MTEYKSDNSFLEKLENLIPVLKTDPAEFTHQLQQLIKAEADTKSDDTFTTPKTLAGKAVPRIRNYCENERIDPAPLILNLWRSGKPEIQLISAQLLDVILRIPSEGTIRILEEFLNDIQNREMGDTLGVFFVLRLQKEAEAWIPYLETLSTDSRHWVRWMVPTAIAVAGPKREDVIPQLLDILQNLMEEEHSKVQKAVSYALRNLFPASPRRVIGFVQSYADTQNKATIAILSDVAGTLGQDVRPIFEKWSTAGDEDTRAKAATVLKILDGK